MRILIIEDEIKTVNYLSKGLTENGFVVDTSHDGEDGLHLARMQSYDLILLDVMLPKLDGWTLLKNLRETHPDIFVLYLTACDEVKDRVKGLGLGADDYLVKPFAFSELLARIRCLQRRSTKQSGSTLVFEDLRVDFNKHQAMRAHQRLHLTVKEFNLLVLFLQRPGEVLSRTLIAELIWDINFDSDTNIIDVAIRRLRQKMDDPFAMKLIHTVRGIGYVLESR